MPKLFHKRELPEPTVDAGEDDDRIIVPAQVHGLLTRTFEGHCLLRVGVDGVDNAYSSAMLKLDEDRGYLVIDALTPGEGNARLKPRTRIVISTLLDELTLRFASRVVKVGKTKELPYYAIAYPDEVCYAQHRREHRVAIPMNWPARVSIGIDEENRIDGVLRDLSSSGFCAQLDAPLPRPVERLPFPLHFVLSLAHDRSIAGEMEICYVFKPESSRRIRIGTRILAITPPHQRVLDQCVAEIDRQQSRLR